MICRLFRNARLFHSLRHGQRSLAIRQQALNTAIIPQNQTVQRPAHRVRTPRSAEHQGGKRGKLQQVTGTESHTSHQVHQHRLLASLFLPISEIPRSQAHLTSRLPSNVPCRILNFSSAFGNSLSYVTGDGSTVASGSLPFDGTLDTSEYEIAVFTDKECNNGCPYWRPNAVSHRKCTCPLCLHIKP